MGWGAHPLSETAMSSDMGTLFIYSIWFQFATWVKTEDTDWHMTSESWSAPIPIK
uniref:Uncharacterized protein n=1 Tax=Arundo donax TaxID=35708 RepID=A0A0A8Y6R8_ARUDO